MAKRGLVPAALCVLTAGCLPNRDNPHDPVNRVTAALVVADWTPNGGSCTGVTPLPPGANPVSVAPIAHCLVLDARLSDGPRDASLRYEFRGGNLATAVTTTSGFLVLDESRFALALGTLAHTFSVTVRSGSDSDEASASAVLVDSYPTAIAALGRTLPAGGFPWAPGQPFDVTLEVEASDPDGDPLLHCWRTTTGGDLGCHESPELPIQLSTSSQILVTVVVASDGALASLPSTQILRVAPPTVWTGTGWIDSNRTSLAAAGLMTPRSVFVDGSYVMTANQSTGPGSIEIFDRATLAPIGGLFDLGLLGFPDHLFVPRFDPVSRRVWAMGLDFKSNSPANVRHRFLSWILSEDGTTLTPDGAQDTVATEPIQTVDIQNGYSPYPFAAISSNGDGWMSSALSTHVYGVHPDGTVFADLELSGHVTGLAARPGREHVWSAWDNSAKLVRLDRDGAATVYPVESTRAIGLAFVDSDRAWTWISERGFVLFDVGRLETTGSFDESVIVEEVVDAVLDWEDGPTFIGDPAIGSLYASCKSDGAVFAIEPDGTVKRFPYTVGVDVVGFDVDGSVFFTSQSEIVRASAPAQNAAFSTGRSALLTSIDWSQGGLWISRNTSPLGGEIVHIDESGGVDDSFSGAVDPNGDAFAIPYLDGAGSVSPDGVVFWSYDTEQFSIPGPARMHSYAITSSNGARVIRSRRHEPLFALSAGYFIASFAPVNDTANQLAWAGGNQFDDLRIFDTRQSEAVAALTLAVRADLAPARSMYSNDLCILTDEASPQLALVRVSPSLTVTPNTTFTPTGGIPILAAGSDAEHDACWVSHLAGGTQLLQAFDRSGVLLHSASIPAGVTDLRAVGAHEILLNESGTITRLTFTPGVLGSPATSPVATGAGPVFTR